MSRPSRRANRRKRHKLLVRGQRRKRRDLRRVHELERQFVGLRFDRMTWSKNKRRYPAPWGGVPVQIDGTWRGDPFYFRYRHDDATLRVTTPGVVLASSRFDLIGDPYGGFTQDLETYGLVRLFRELLGDLAPADYYTNPTGVALIDQAVRLMSGATATDGRNDWAGMGQRCRGHRMGQGIGTRAWATSPCGWKTYGTMTLKRCDSPGITHIPFRCGKESR